MEINYWLIAGGILIGLLLGFVIQRSKFCMAAAVSNLVLMKDTRQLHAYLAAIVVAVLGTQLLQLTGLVALDQAAYLKPQVNLVGALVGGLIFGIGTVFSGGCVGRTVVRAGEGNLGAVLVLLVAALMAAITMYGPLEAFRMDISQSVPLALSSETSSLRDIATSNQLFSYIVVFTLCLALISFLVLRLFRDKVQDRSLVAAGVFIGLLVVAGWFVTGFLSQDDFSIHRPSSLSFAGPLANTAYMTLTGSSMSESAVFGMLLLLGVVAGSLGSALLSRSFSWRLPELHNVKHLVMGGIFMGFGAVVAGGCNIGHGLSGASTLSVASLIAVIAIVLGMRVGLWLLIRSEDEQVLPFKDWWVRRRRLFSLSK